MPIYEYACETCGHRFEKLMRMSADAPPCDACGEAVRKLVSASSFVLKGGGWYADGYGASKPTSTSDSTSSSSAPPASASSPAPTSSPAPASSSSSSES